MSHEILGDTFDIHGGGLDLLFPHHENERAQSSCCHGAPMVKYWMHNGLMRAGEKGKVGGKGDRQESPDEAAAGKISRSKGGGGLAELIGRHGGETLRFFLLRTHYRSTIVYSEEGLQEAQSALEAFYRFFDRFDDIVGGVQEVSFYQLSAARSRSEGDFDPGQDPLLTEMHAARQRFLAAMDDDFNTGGAMSVLFDSLRILNRHIDSHQLTASSDGESAAVKSLIRATTSLRELAGLLGLFIKPPPTTAGGDQDDRELLESAIALLIDLRKEARERKDYATSDAIRDRLGEAGIALLDKKEGTTWEKSS
jgi:cysteinyl-tRNA synthetase